MRKKYALTITLIAILVGMWGVDSTLGQRTVGVEVGDWGEYTVFYSGNATFPPQLPLNLEWAKLTVQKISGTNVTFEQMYHYSNGSEPSGINSVDVDTGQGHGCGMLIAKNLNESNLIYTSPPPSGPFGLNLNGAAINETIGKSYVDKDAKVNHLNLTALELYPEGNTTLSFNFYWYQATGMLTEMSVYLSNQWNNGTTTWLEYGIVITSVIPEFPSPIVLPLFLMATLLTAFAYRRKRRASQRCDVHLRKARSIHSTKLIPQVIKLEVK